MPDDLQFSAGGIVLHEDRLLLIETRRTCRWQLPKGHLERGETPRQAAVREIREETGAAVTVLDHAGEVEYRFRGPHGRWIFKHVDFFRCEFAGQVSDRCDPHEVQRAQWHRWDRALELLAFANERELVRAALERSRGSWGTPTTPSLPAPPADRVAPPDRRFDALCALLDSSPLPVGARLGGGVFPPGDRDGPKEIP